MAQDIEGLLQYVPRPAPFRTEDLPRYVEDELRRLGTLLSGLSIVVIHQSHAPPSKIEDGMVVLADGTDWNPGSGAGFYGRRGGTWVLLG